MKLKTVGIIITIGGVIGAAIYLANKSKKENTPGTREYSDNIMRQLNEHKRQAEKKDGDHRYSGDSKDTHDADRWS